MTKPSTNGERTVTSGRGRTSQAVISFEYFPPKDVTGERALLTCAHALRRFAPAFQTVTFGADGGEREATLHWTVALEELTGTPTASHLTTCAFDRDGLLERADTLWDEGIRRLVLLRGDAVTDGVGLAGFASLAEAVAALRRRHAFDISVAAYPEKHPRAESLDADFDVLLAKVDAGAARAITQFFFDDATFLRLRDRLSRARPSAVLVPGIIPVGNFKRIVGFAERCNTAVPDAMREAFEAVEGDREATSQVARDLVTEQARNLAGEGVRHLHVYTLNRIDLAADAARAFQTSVPDDAVRLGAVA